MRCPKCETENPEDAKSCCSCGKELITTASDGQESTAKTSALAITSLILGILTITPLYLIAGIPAIICGIVALVKIERSSDKLKGKNLASAGIIIPAIWLLLFFVYVSFTRVRRYGPPPHSTQRAQLHSIDCALELFCNEFDSYPPSDALNLTDKPYCGAMKLCEAMMGQDLRGFHEQSVYRADGKDVSGTKLLYPEPADTYNLKLRKGPFLPSESANAHRLKDIYDNVGLFDGNTYVLCDVYAKKRHSNNYTGMPILYYKADTTKTKHNLDNPDDPNNIYNYRDNYFLLALGVSGEPNKKHPLFANPKLFYEMFRSRKVTTACRPYRADSYILLSAGYDGLYGTKDDIVNFDMRWKPK